jgi:hypothetical protein
MLLKPVSRPPFVLSKVIAYGPDLVSLVLIPAGVAYLELRLLGGGGLNRDFRMHTALDDPFLHRVCGVVHTS